MKRSNVQVLSLPSHQPLDSITTVLLSPTLCITAKCHEDTITSSYNSDAYSYRSIRKCVKNLVFYSAARCIRHVAGQTEGA